MQILHVLTRQFIIRCSQILPLAGCQALCSFQLSEPHGKLCRWVSCWASIKRPIIRRGFVTWLTGQVAGQEPRIQSSVSRRQARAGAVLCTSGGVRYGMDIAWSFNVSYTSEPFQFPQHGSGISGLRSICQAMAMLMPAFSHGDLQRDCLKECIRVDCTCNRKQSDSFSICSGS